MRIRRVLFAADSHAALQRLSGDRTITTAAGLIAIADAFTAGNGPGWLIEHVAHKAAPAATAPSPTPATTTACSARRPPGPPPAGRSILPAAWRRRSHEPGAPSMTLFSKGDGEGFFVAFVNNQPLS